MFKKCKVVMLATNQKAEGMILLGVHSNTLRITTRANSGNKLYNTDSYDESHKFMQLYILSDDKIEEGDWCINSYDNQIWQYKQMPCPLPYWGNKNTLTKIIATTDISLNNGNILVDHIQTNSKNGGLIIQYPQPSQSFINKFIDQYNKGNVITDIMVEYERWDNLRNILADDYTFESKQRLKTSKDNTITIRPIKNEWTKDEIVIIATKAWELGASYGDIVLPEAKIEYDKFINNI